ncbi:sensor histidine kinase [Methylomonas koyamae]|uniref:sensor histidine kinase n=1 Tax=Methylomonas koyamae TaxID=702114 RepID=UPI0011268428|nr:HAMP domain-containing sensor histidine kinase [Methylomonas koyamae]TPQ28533.1 sensor histidine kinase [Methylomonas koyamae]
MSGRLERDALFPTLLAFTVHDIKNSLGTLLELIRQFSAKRQTETGDLGLLEFEAVRINHSLMQLLVLYKVGAQKFSLDIDQCAVLDVLQEAVDQQARLSTLHEVELRLDCTDELQAYCDFDNIANALAAVLNNALRYTRQTVLVSAEQDGDYLQIAIEDDGTGYPPHFLQADLTNAAELDWVNGNTGLGLYFVSVIAGLHKNAGRCGYVTIDNSSRLGGARFRLFLP